MYLSSVVVDGFRAATEGPLTCELPGRFAVLLGANATGKSTVSDAIALAHRTVFPWRPRSSDAVLSRSRDRVIHLTYKYEDEEVLPIWQRRQASGAMAPQWRTQLSSAMGEVRTRIAEDTPREAREVFDNLPLLYLPSTRNPVQDLAGRDARLIVEMLRAEAKRQGTPRSMAGLRKHLGNLIGTIFKTEALLQDAETRVAGSFATLTSGVAKRSSFLGTSDVDDAMLARIFEFFVGPWGVERQFAHRLETEGLGYANLLQLAVVLAAIPDLTQVPSSGGTAGDPVDGEATSEGIAAAAEDDERSNEERLAELAEAEEIAAAEDDSIFKDQFHACVVLDEPEAHLHPQLQHGLVRYLKEVVDRRPELQVIMTTHSDEIVAACDPDDLVVFRRSGRSQPVARTVAALDLEPAWKTRVRRHLDVTRSASFFADRMALVEGITDAQLLRRFGRVWAAGDEDRVRFIGALTITVMGSRVGEWLPALLTHPGQEIASRVAVLMDSDGKVKPGWAQAREGEHFMVFLSEPTLEPALYRAMPDLMRGVLEAVGVELRASNTDVEAGAEELIEWLKEAGKRKKALIAEETLDAIDEKERSGSDLAAPGYFADLLDWLYDGFHDTPPTASEQTSDVTPDGGETPAES